MRPNPQVLANLATFTEETINGKLHLLCSVQSRTVKQEIYKGNAYKGNEKLIFTHFQKTFAESKTETREPISLSNNII